MRTLVSFVAGLIFSVGLILSGMANPAKVQNFLDVFGSWDPSLAFVMGGAVIVTAIGYRLSFSRPAPMFDDRFHLPWRTAIDSRLLIGSALFGVGWGLSGFCPGPALVAVPLLAKGTLVFVPCMIFGLVAGRKLFMPPPGVKSGSAC